MYSGYTFPVFLITIELPIQWLEHVFRLHLSCDQFQEHVHGGLRSSLTLEFYRKAYDHIITQYPYWNRSSGKDHIWV